MPVGALCSGTMALAGIMHAEVAVAITACCLIDVPDGNAHVTGDVTRAHVVSGAMDAVVSLRT
jgi:leucyl aminopeptidase